MIEINKDKKSPTWIITQTDNEGFHRQLAVTRQEMNQLVQLWIRVLIDRFKNN